MTTTLLEPVSLTADAPLIRVYGELTDDFNPIHVDPEFARQTPMGGCIAHGTLSIGLIYQALHRGLGADLAGALELDVRFVKPVREGETIEAGGERLPGDDEVYRVWVRGSDGADRVVGTARVGTAEAAA